MNTSRVDRRTFDPDVEAAKDVLTRVTVLPADMSPWDLEALASDLLAARDEVTCDDCTGCDCCDPPVALEAECCAHCIHELAEEHPR